MLVALVVDAVLASNALLAFALAALGDDTEHDDDDALFARHDETALLAAIVAHALLDMLAFAHLRARVGARPLYVAATATLLVDGTAALRHGADTHAGATGVVYALLACALAMSAVHVAIGARRRRARDTAPKCSVD